jgi:hypothetical protein
VVNIATAPERAQLPIRGLQGDRDSHLTALNVQWEMATARAAQQGTEISHEKCFRMRRMIPSLMTFLTR